MGILLEADYKSVLSGKESPIAGLKKAFDSARATSHNPLREEGENAQLTYETMNRDSGNYNPKPTLLVYLSRSRIAFHIAAITLAEESLSATNTIQTFLYVSAADGTVVLPDRYISTKREAEAGIKALSVYGQRFRPIFFRPGFLYDSSRPITIPLAGIMGITSSFNSLFGGKLPMGAAGYKPLKVEVVAEAAIEAIASEGVEGPVEVSDIEELSTKAWRAAML